HRPSTTPPHDTRSASTTSLPHHNEVGPAIHRIAGPTSFSAAAQGHDPVSPRSPTGGASCRWAQSVTDAVPGRHDAPARSSGCPTPPNPPRTTHRPASNVWTNMPQPRGERPGPCPERRRDGFPPAPGGRPPWREATPARALPHRRSRSRPAWALPPRRGRSRPGVDAPAPTCTSPA
ncbi:hypothetical protein OY671_005653, partial [Metschnikowia pulcherrima]